MPANATIKEQRDIKNNGNSLSSSHVISAVQGVIFALSKGPPAVMKLLTHAEDHLT